MRQRRRLQRRQLLRDRRSAVAESEPVRLALLRRDLSVPAVAILLSSFLALADVDDPQIGDAIARILDHIRYQAAAQPLWGSIEVDGADDLVIIVEPIDARARQSLAGVGRFGRPQVLWWDE